MSARAIFRKPAKARAREEGDGIGGIAFELQKLRVENFSGGVYCFARAEIFFGLRRRQRCRSLVGRLRGGVEVVGVRDILYPLRFYFDDCCLRERLVVAGEEVGGEIGARPDFAEVRALPALGFAEFVGGEFGSGKELRFGFDDMCRTIVGNGGGAVHCGSGGRF